MHPMDDIVKASFDETTAHGSYYNTTGPGPARLLVMSGLPMSGKSHLTNLISERMEGKVCVVRTDTIRPVIARHMGRVQPAYDRKEHQLVFGLGSELIGAALERRWAVIADATNLTEEYRRWAVEAAKAKGDQTIVVFLEASSETAMERSLEKDRDGSAATPAVYALLRYDREPIENCTMPHIVINSETDVKPWADVLAKWLAGSIDRVPGTVIPKRH